MLFLDNQSNLPDMDTRIYNSLKYKELAPGVLCSDFMADNEVLIPYSVISNDHFSQDNDIYETVKYNFLRHTVSLRLKNGLFAPAELYIGLQLLIKRKNLKTHECNKSFSQLVYKIEQFLYRDNGVNVNYRQTVRLHDLSLTFPGTMCEHLLQNEIDTECSKCNFRLVTVG